MSYINKTATILGYLGYTQAEPIDGVDGDYTILDDAGTVSINWLNTEPADPYYPDGPTEQQVLDIYNSQAFQDWQAENGGDPVLTTRKDIRDSLETPTGKVVKALVQVLIDQGIIQATPQQVLTAVLNKINEGAVD